MYVLSNMRIGLYINANSYYLFIQHIAVFFHRNKGKVGTNK